jgi:DNA processing protein
MNSDLLYQIGLGQLRGLGSIQIKKMLALCGDAKSFFETPAHKFSRVEGIGEIRIKSMNRKEALKIAEKELEYIQRNKISCLFYTDPNYPTRLKHCIDGPLLLFGKGNANFNVPKVISIVGTRNITAYGKEMVEKIVADLAEHQVLVISGLAHGVDVHAHLAAMKNGLPTVGVLGHGLDTIYPAIHRGVAAKMVLESGGLITEFLSDMKGNRENFPKRNRVVAGMADAILVIEASEKGGALITANIAHSYNRDVFAVPGRVGDEYSLGCLNLIRRNVAQLVTSSKDIIQALNWDIAKSHPQKQMQLNLDLNELEQELVNLLDGVDSRSMDDIAFGLGLKVSQLSVLTLALELRGLIHILPGNRCKRAY